MRPLREERLVRQKENRKNKKQKKTKNEATPGLENMNIADDADADEQVGTEARWDEDGESGRGRRVSS